MTASLVHHEAEFVDVDAEHVIAERDAIKASRTEQWQQDPARETGGAFKRVFSAGQKAIKKHLL